MIGAGSGGRVGDVSACNLAKIRRWGTQLDTEFGWTISLPDLCVAIWVWPAATSSERVDVWPRVGDRWGTLRDEQ